MAVAGYNPFIAADRQKQYMVAQQQEALAQALLSEGEKPIDTNNRSIGGVGFAISPWEGAAKLGNILAGGYTQSKANDALANALTGGSGGGQSSLGNLPPQVAALAQAYPEIGVKAIMDNALADHRAGSTYYDMGSGGRTTAPTDQQINTGTVPQMPQMQPIPNGAPITPVQSGAIPPPQGAMPPQYANAAPSPAAVGTSAMEQGAPPINASALGGAPMQSAMPTVNTQGMSAAQAAAAIETAKANAIAQGAIQPAAQKANAEDNAKNLAESQKTLNVMQSNLPQALDRFEEMRNFAKNASYGTMETSGIGNTIANSGLNPDNKTAIANARLEQLSAQGILPELGPALAQAGIKGNKFLETLSSSASGLNLSDKPAAKLSVIDGLQSQYIKNLVSTNQQIARYGGQPVNLSQYNVFSGKDDPGFATLPSGAKFFDATSGQQMVKH